MDRTIIQRLHSVSWWSSIQKKKNEWQLENYQKYARRLYWNAFIWIVSADQTFYGQWTVRQELSRSGTELVTKYWPGWFLTFSPHEWIQTTLPRGKHSIIMQTWIVSWCWFCLFSQTQNQRQAELCVFFGSHTFVPVGWSCKKKQTAVSHNGTEAEVLFFGRWSASGWNFLQ